MNSRRADGPLLRLDRSFRWNLNHLRGTPGSSSGRSTAWTRTLRRFNLGKPLTTSLVPADFGMLRGPVLGSYKQGWSSVARCYARFDAMDFFVAFLILRPDHRTPDRDFIESVPPPFVRPCLFKRAACKVYFEGEENVRGVLFRCLTLGSRCKMNSRSRSKVVDC